METEYIKSMHSNYARVLLEEQPDEKRYQFCILERGGIRGLLPCSMRRIDNETYLYYDITSQQNITELFKKKRISRKWIRDFMWSLKEIQMELDRFLLDDTNILWFPEYVYQNLENHIFLFMYMPYYTGENGFLKLLDFIVENLDYEDEELVECAYKIYGKYEENGDVYLQGHIFEDVKALEENEEGSINRTIPGIDTESAAEESAELMQEYAPENKKINAFSDKTLLGDPEKETRKETQKEIQKEAEKNIEKEKRKKFSLFEKKTREKTEKDHYRQMLKLQMEGQAVAEETNYGKDYGRTFFVEQPKEEEPVRRLYTPDERVLAVLEEDCITIGKYEEEVDVVIKDPSVSRLHARITKENGRFFVEDMNSTNGTSKNGLKLKPYEKKVLNEDDELVLGKVALRFR